MGDLLPDECQIRVEWKTGDRATYLRRDSRGYGFLTRVPVEIVRVTAKRARVRNAAGMETTVALSSLSLPPPPPPRSDER